MGGISKRQALGAAAHSTELSCHAHTAKLDKGGRKRYTPEPMKNQTTVNKLEHAEER